jgi:type III secretion protein Y
MTTRSEHGIELLHALGHFYGMHGQIKRGLALLVIAARLAPDHVGVLRTLANALLMDGAPERAVAVLTRMRQLEGGDHPVTILLTSKALWMSGRQREARTAFRDFLVQTAREPL